MTRQAYNDFVLKSLSKFSSLNNLFLCSSRSIQAGEFVLTSILRRDGGRCVNCSGCVLRLGNQFDYFGRAKLNLIVLTGKKLGSLIEKLVKCSSKDLENIEESLVQLKILLIKIKGILALAVVDEVKDPGILLWLKRIQHSAYIAEDLIDRLYIRYIQGSCENSKITVDDLNKSLTEITEFVTNTGKLINDYGWFRDSGLWKKDSEVFNRIYESTSNSFERVIFGRESVIKELLDKVEDLASKRISVISVVGITGIGKTTVAQSLFREPQIIEQYVRIWFSMHQDFHLDTILKSIIESLTGEKSEVLNSHHLHAEFTRHIRGRCIFLVLDNARHEVRKDWSELLSTLSCAAKGSVVLVTTQSPVVSSVIGSRLEYELPKLSEEDCWSVFHQTVFPSEDYGVKHPKLCDIGREIVKRCYGLPLIATTLGHLLFGQDDIKEWKSILNTKLWNLPLDDNAVAHSLRLCYHQLPEYLKVLVPYCGLLSRNFQFEKETLVQLWMAEELIQPKGNMQLEDLGHSYFDELVKRGFFVRSSDEDALKFVVHGFVNDMVQLVNVDGSFRSIIREKSDLLQNTDFVRHVSIDMGGLDLEVLKSFKRLRTILLLSGSGSISNITPSDMKFVRVLDLSRSSIKILPSTISLLSQLRYLNVSHTRVRFIFKEVYDICRLQTLKLTGCTALTELPEGIGRCESLRHLDIDESSIFATPSDIGKLTQLQGLRRFAVSLGGCNINQLENLNMLRDSLCISGLEHVDVKDRPYGCVVEKENLKRLKLVWASSRQVDEWITECLQPHSNLRELVIQGYPVPTWSVPWQWSSPSSLEKIELVNCDNLRNIIILRDLPSLKTLTLQGNKSVEKFDVQGFLYLRSHTAALNHWKSYRLFRGLEMHCVDCFGRKSYAKTWQTIHHGMPSIDNRTRLRLLILVEEVGVGGV